LQNGSDTSNDNSAPIAAAKRSVAVMDNRRPGKARRAVDFWNANKRNGCAGVNHDSIWDSWPIAFLGCPRGH